MHTITNLRHTSAGWQSGLGRAAERHDAEPRPEREGYVRIKVPVRLISITRPGAPRTWIRSTSPRPALPDRFEVIRRRLGYEVANLTAQEVPL